MPDTKINGAIALARRIVQDGEDPDDLPRQDTYSLARALLDATAPGAQYRAGLEAAATRCDSRAEYGRECEREGSASSPNWIVTEAESLARDIRAAIAALPASPDPAPVAMPELRWEGQSLMLGKIRLGGTRVDLGLVPWAWDGWTVGSITDRLQVRKGPPFSFATESDARTAVEAAVRERLGIGMGAKGRDHG